MAQKTGTDAQPAKLAQLRSALPYLVAAGLFAMSALAIHHLLGPVTLRQVLAEIRTTPWSVIWLALAATAAAYAALISYDRSVLRGLNAPLPLRVVVTGGFLGYALGNPVGAGPATGGAVRDRIYSALGLTSYDRAAIAVFGSVTFAVGALGIAFVALAWAPVALMPDDTINPAPVRGVAIGALTVLAGLLIAFGLVRSEVQIRGHTVRTPEPRRLLVQLGWTGVDIVMAATVLFVLLGSGDVGFVPLLGLFAAAMFAGHISQVPGGIGVFETVILVGMSATVPVDQTAAALILYRLIYYIAPFMLALVMLAVSEFRMPDRSRGSTARLPGLAPLFGAVSAVVPLAMSATIFGAGVVMLLSSVIPASDRVAQEMELLLPLGLVEGGALLSSAIGAALLVIAHGMARRVEGAYWLALAALAAGIVAALLQGLDAGRAVFLALILLILLPCRREFYRIARLTRNPLSLRWCLLLASIGVAAAAVFFFAYKAAPYSHELWWQFATNQRAPRAMRAGLVGALALMLFALITALRPPRVTAERATAEQIARAAEVIDTQANPDANLALTGDKSLLFSDTGRAFLMYSVQGRSWIALGDPVGDTNDVAQLVWDFVDAACAANARPVFYAVTPGNLTLWAEMGLALHKMGEEAIVPLLAFSLDGPRRKRLRTTYNRAGRDGLTFDMLPGVIDDATLDSLRMISDRWLADRKTAEKRFSVGRFDAAYLRRCPVAIVRHHGRIVAFANVLVTPARDMATIDLMRHTGDAPAGVMEYLFTALILHLKAEGYAAFSLGMAPLAGLEYRRGSRWTVRLGALVYRHGGHFYNFDGLRAFKDKFDPQWQPRFLVAPARANIVLVAADAATLIAGGIRQAVSKP